MRAALYARFSTDLQNPKSAEDQLVECRRLAERLGFVVVAAFKDEARSGYDDNRQGLRDLVGAARSRPRPFDVVIAEGLERLARSGGGTWDVYEDLEALGIPIHTLEQGEIDETKAGVYALTSAINRKQNRSKVRRGLAAVIRDGRYVAAPPYGYRRVLRYDDRGEPIRGLIEIDPAEATIVRRAAAEFLAGSSAQAIATRFNAEGIKAPAGGQWHANALLGDARRLQGIFRNPIYAGEIVWNRATHPKDRRTGRVMTRSNAPEAYVRQPAPDLRIIDADTWAGVQARQAEVAARVRAAGNPSAGNAPRRLLTGLLKCGLCGSALTTAGPGRRYRCRARTDKGPAACANARSAVAEELEAEVLAQLRRDLLHPEVIEDVVREYHALRARKDQAGQVRKREVAAELEGVRRKLSSLADQVADQGVPLRTLAGRMAELEQREDQLAAELAGLEAAADVVRIHPRAAERYRELVEDLSTRLAAAIAAGGQGGQGGTAATDAAREKLRQVVRTVRMLPLPERGRWRIEIDGDLTGLLESAAVAGVGPTSQKRRA